MAKHPSQPKPKPTKPVPKNGHSAPPPAGQMPMKGKATGKLC